MHARESVKRPRIQVLVTELYNKPHDGVMEAFMP